MRGGQGARASSQGPTVYVLPFTFGGRGFPCRAKDAKEKVSHIPSLSLCLLMSTAFAFINVLQVTFAFESANLNSHLLGSLLGYPS